MLLNQRKFKMIVKLLIGCYLIALSAPGHIILCQDNNGHFAIEMTHSQKLGKSCDLDCESEQVEIDLANHHHHHQCKDLLLVNWSSSLITQINYLPILSPRYDHNEILLNNQNKFNYVKNKPFINKSRISQNIVIQV